MQASEISFLSSAEKLTLQAYLGPSQYSVVLSEVVSRLAAAVLLSPAAVLDLAFHGVLALSTWVYVIGKSLYSIDVDFSIPWEHLQRVRNAVAPALFGSIFGLIHPYAGLAMSEPTDKHIVMGMLASNVEKNLEAPCSPIHSLSIIEEIAKNHRYAEVDGVKKEIFSDEHIQLIDDAQNYEKSLQGLQAQEYIHKITNVTLFVMAKIIISIEQSSMSDFNKELLERVSGLLIPVLTAVDIAIILIAQAFFLATGVARVITGRGPIYTEVTANPLMHLCFFIQSMLKAAGNLVGTFVWFYSPQTGFIVSLMPAHAFFNFQMNHFMSGIQQKLESAKEDDRFVLPILFGDGDCSALSVPSHSMHKTYLIVEKQAGAFNLYWVNRPNISQKLGLSANETLVQLRSMFDERFPFMDIEKLKHYPVKSKQPEFTPSTEFAKIADQGGSTNCVVSNLFGTLEALDRLREEEEDITALRYQVVREALVKDYGFYKNDFFPFAEGYDGFSLTNIWKTIEAHPSVPI